MREYNQYLTLSSSLIMISNLIFAFTLLSCSLSQYVSFQNITNFTINELSAIEISWIGDYIYTQSSKSFYIFHQDGQSYRAFQIGLGWPLGRNISAGASAVTIGQSIWYQPNSEQDYYPLQNFTNCNYSRISRFGLIAVCWNSSSRGAYVWTRKYFSSNFNLSSTLSTLQNPTDAYISQNGSVVAIVTGVKVYLFQNKSDGYFISQLFFHDLPFAQRPKIVASKDFDLLIVRDNSTMNVFSNFFDHFQFTQTISYNTSIIDFTLDNSTQLVLAMADSTLKVWNYDGKRFNQGQNISFPAIAVIAKRGVLVALNKFAISIWKNVQIEQIQSSK